MNASDGEVYSGKGQKDGFVVLVEEVESSIRPGLLVDGPRNFVELAEAIAGIVDGREKLQVAAIGGQQQFPERAQTVDGFLHWRELHDRFAIALFYLAVVLEKGDILDSSFNPKDVTELVIHLDRGHSHGVADASAFDPHVVAVSYLVL